MCILLSDLSLVQHVFQARLYSTPNRTESTFLFPNFLIRPMGMLEGLHCPSNTWSRRTGIGRWYTHNIDPVNMEIICPLDSLSRVDLICPKWMGKPSLRLSSHFWNSAWGEYLAASENPSNTTTQTHIWRRKWLLYCLICSPAVIHNRRTYKPEGGQLYLPLLWAFSAVM